MTSAWVDPEAPIVPGSFDVALVARSSNLLLRPGSWYGKGGLGGECTCSWVPRDLGPQGMELSALFPALPPTVTEVELRVPGFPPLVGPVTRR